MKFVTLLGSVMLVAAAPALARAQENQFAVGYYHFDLGSESDDLSGPFTPPGIRARSQDAESVALVYSRTVHPNWTVNFAIGAPPNYALDGAGVAVGLGRIGEARAISPTILVQYHFWPERRVSPFVGGGASWNHFYSAEATTSLNTALGGTTQIEIDDAPAYVAIAGVEIDLSSRWVLTGSVAWSMLEVDGTLSTGPIDRRLSLALDPSVYRATLGYRF
jgi:outer membrane protein